MGVSAGEKETGMIPTDATRRTTDAVVTGDRKEIAGSLLKLGATSYGGPAMLGIMQGELQEKRQWVSKERFLEGLAVANMLPGATAAQLGIFFGYARGGLWGGVLAGLCFVLPGFFIMLALTVAYASLGVTPIARGALYGLGPVVLGLFGVAVYRLGRAAASTLLEAVIAVLAGAAAIGTPFGIVGILLLAGATGLIVFHPGKPRGLLVVIASVIFVGVLSIAWWVTTSAPAAVAGGAPIDRASSRSGSSS
jgi:chromate transporter